jgi:hypothetical protein
METREILLKADKVSVVFERTADGKISNDAVPQSAGYRQDRRHL